MKMTKKLINRSDGVSQYYNITNLKKFNENYEAISRVGNRYIYQKKEKEKVIRNQVVWNSDYAISLRAIGFNKTEIELENALREALNSNSQLETIPFNTEGFESEELDEKEDLNIRGDKITVELNIRGNTTILTY